MTLQININGQHLPSFEKVYIHVQFAYFLAVQKFWFEVPRFKPKSCRCFIAEGWRIREVPSFRIWAGPWGGWLALPLFKWGFARYSLCLVELYSIHHPSLLRQFLFLLPFGGTFYFVHIHVLGILLRTIKSQPFGRYDLSSISFHQV